MVDIVKGRDSKKEKLNKYRVLVRAFHSCLLKFGLPRDIIRQIMFAEEFKLKSSEEKQLRIYLEMVYYWKNLGDAQTAATGSMKGHNRTSTLSELAPEQQQSFTTLDVSYVEYIFQEKESLWYKKHKQIRMQPDSQLAVMTRGEKWLKALAVRDQLHDDLDLESFQNTDANWRKIWGNNQKQVNNLVAYQPFKLSDKKMLSNLAALPDEHPTLQKHLDALNEILKAFAIKQGMKDTKDMEKFKDLTVFVYQMVGMDGDDLEDDREDDSMQLTSKLSLYDDKALC